MSDEQDSWFKSAFGVDLGQSVQNIKDEASAAIGQAVSTVTQVVQGAQGVVEGAISGVTGAVTGAAKKVAGAVSGSPGAEASGGGTGSFPLGGSVGRGGKNAPNDVRAVQAALGIAADGQCGGQTIAAIEAFQRNMGQARPDGRVDAGGATERALAGGATPPPPAAPEGDDLRGLPGEPVDEPADDADGPATNDVALNGQIKAELGSQIEAQTANRGGLIGELNDLENFTKTDPDPVPEFPASFAGADPAGLANDMKEKEFTIAQMDKQRIGICKQARKDARLVSDGAKSDLTAALVGGPGVGFGAGVAMVAASMAGGTLALLATEVTALIAVHEIFRKYRDTIRSIVDKAHSDLTVANTAIAIENKKLAAMSRALNAISPIDEL